MPDCWLEVSIRQVLRPGTSAQGFLGFPVSISKFQRRTDGGVQTPSPEIPKALQNRAKLNPIVKCSDLWAGKCVGERAVPCVCLHCFATVKNTVGPGGGGYTCHLARG